MGVVGSYVNNLQLRKTPLSALQWQYEWSSEAYVVRHGLTGLMLGYMTREMAYGTIFTSESLLANWIWRVSGLCIGSEASPEPLLMPVDRK